MSHDATLSKCMPTPQKSAFGRDMTLTFDLEKNPFINALHSHNLYHYTKYRAIASRKIGVNGRQTDGRTTRNHNASSRVSLAAET